MTKTPCERTMPALVSLLGTILLACTALYGQATALFMWLWLYRSRQDGVTLGLLGTAVGAMLTALGGVFLVAPLPAAAAEFGARVHFVGKDLAAWSFFEMALAVVGVRAPRSLRAAIALVLGLSALVGAVGALHDPSSIRSALGHEPELSPLGVVLMTVTLLVALAGLAVLGRAAPRHAGARWLTLGAVPAIGAAVIELGLRLRGTSPPFGQAVAGSILMFVATWVLLRRFEAVGIRLREKTVELEHSHAALLRAQKERVRAEQLASVGELTVVLASEIARPMRSLQQAVALLDSAHVEDGGARAVLDVIDAETSHLNALVRDLLVYARPSQEERRPVAVATLVEDAIRDVSAQHRSELGIEVRSELPDDAAVDVELEAMRRALAHVLDNAVEAGEAGGDSQVTVRTRAGAEGRVRIEVSDRGLGMDVQVRQHALDPFFTTRPHGTGLGLAIVARVARAHGGNVEIESADGAGTTVAIELPRCELRPSSPDAMHARVA